MFFLGIYKKCWWKKICFLTVKAYFNDIFRACFLQPDFLSVVSQPNNLYNSFFLVMDVFVSERYALGFYSYNHLNVAYVQTRCI